MQSINEQTFLSELLRAFPEFVAVHEKNKKDHDIGVHIILGDFRRFTDTALAENNEEVLTRIRDFIIRCHTESNDEVNNAVFVTYFENMGEETLEYFYKNLPQEFV